MVPDDFPLVDLHTISNYTFFPTVMHAWRWMTSTSWWHAKISMTFKNTWFRDFPLNLLTTSKNAPNLTQYGRYCMQNNQLPTKCRVELKDNSRVLQGVNSSCSFWRPLKTYRPLVDKDKTKNTFEVSVHRFSEVYKYMDSRAPEQLTKGIAKTLEKSSRYLLYTTPEVLSCKLDLLKNRKSCKQSFDEKQRPLLPFTCLLWK